MPRNRPRQLTLASAIWTLCQLAGMGGLSAQSMPPNWDEPAAQTESLGAVPVGGDVYAIPCDSAGCDALSLTGDGLTGRQNGAPTGPFGFTFGGWLDQGTTFNSRNPQNPRAGFGNLPVTFNYRNREYQLNQLYLYAERAADGACGIGFGGRVDLLVGEDYVFTQAVGLETEDDGSGHWNVGQGGNHSGLNGSTRVGVALPQAYAEIAYGNLTTKIGHFYTIIGNETVTAPDNFFYSHAYTMQYGEPFTHTGILTQWDIAERLTLYGGIVNGWDKFDALTDRGSFLGGFFWTLPNERTELNLALITGDEDGAGPPLLGNRTMYSVVLNHAISDRLQMILQHDLGVQENGDLITNDDAEWYGLNSYLLYTINDRWKAGFRYEWFNDDDGTRVVNEAGDFQQITTGLNWSPCSFLTVRPETRWDWFDPEDPNAPAGPYDNFSTRSQFTFAVDAIVIF